MLLAMLWVRSHATRRLLTLVFVGFFATVALAATAPAPAQANCSHSAESVNRISKKNARSAIQCLFNKMRSAKNVKRNGNLEQAAQNHSSTMASSGCFSHQCLGEPNLRDRVARTGYLRGASGWELGEVILVAHDQTSSRNIANAFGSSSSHRATITKSSFDHVGIGISFRGGRVYVTGDFGHR